MHLLVSDVPALVVELPHTDMPIVTVNVLDDHLSGCGDAGIACVAPVSRAGNPLGAMDLVIGEEAWSIGIRRSSGGHTLPAR